ncbi:MAG: ribose 5-phosphate isomerase B [Erysipelotrichaceae bacterium]|nr:ribose 5-phosphate isomerase B [Erysipelotrichaceae bacterium]
MIISIGSDHAGYDYKEAIKKHLIENGHEVIDVGTDSKESVHYPKFAFAAGEAVVNGEADFGIVVCSSGEGIGIAANKVKGVRCAIGYNDHVSEYARRHNDANMISFGASQMQLDEVLRRVDIFLATEFDGGRHQIRVDLIKDYENK